MTQHTVVRQFRKELLQCAQAVDIPLTDRAIRPTLRISDPKSGSVTLCFRVRAQSSGALDDLANLAGFQRAYVVSDKGEEVRVTCVLSGAAIGIQPVDWSGRPIQSIG